MRPGDRHVLDHRRASDVARLVAAQAWPSVSILMDTVPAERMQAGDVRRLSELSAEAERRLSAHSMLKAGPLAMRLKSMVDEASRGPTGRGIALFASLAVEQTVRLPIQVQPRAVVERTFATRDLVQALHRTPPHLIVLLHGMCAHFYRGYADTLVPLHPPHGPLEHAPPVVGRLNEGDVHVEEFLTRVDRTLSQVRAEHPSPIVLAGAKPVVDLFLRRSRNLHRLAATVIGPAADNPTALCLAARSGIESYLLSREQEALDKIRAAHDSAPKTLAVGIEACWRAARRHRPTMLVLDETYTYPARDTGDQITPIDPHHTADGPGTVHHDLVDDLIETVIDRGGWIALTHPGALSEHGNVALLHQPNPTPHEGGDRD